MVEIELIPFGVDTSGNEHTTPCNCDTTDPPDVEQICGDSFCNITECDAAFNESSVFHCKDDCDYCSDTCRKGCSAETGADGEFRQELCYDGIDNDGDGNTDCYDPACWSYNEKVCGTCGDGIDNDQNDATDCDDPECFGDEACLTSCINDDQKCTHGSNDTCCIVSSSCTCNARGKNCRCLAGQASA